ncbi:MAG: RsmB/NOP family class I SAM-dependent RNA methyltransferase, partial [Butyrivibrio sp.]|nr:RsmB/NOP family class I SAM-dependent RNA methyltransferase [Butyrivibrio sp.]
FHLTKIPWTENGFYYEKEDDPARHPFYYAGLYYLQEPSAMTPASILPVLPGERVLDMCAAPGGKATALAAKLRGEGLLVANDISASRAKALLKNLEIFGVKNAFVTNAVPHKMAEQFEEYFDKILVDAPCSGEGMFRKDSKLIKAWESNGPEYFAPIQKNILDSAANMLKPGGKILYSTCTFSRLEDEDNIRDFLDNHPDFSLEKIYDYEGFVRAFGMEEAIRLFPHHLDGEGHFVALLRRNGVLQENNMPRDIDISKLPAVVQDFLREFDYENLPGPIHIINDKIYSQCDCNTDLKGLRILRNGLLLGELKKDRFEPSQALAMYIKPENYSTVVNLSPDDINTIKYLKGETIEIEEASLRGSSKNVLIAVDNFSLGWGKLNGLTIKNKYLPGWRLM